MDYIYFTLNEPISCEKLCNKINRFINSIGSENMVLEIGLKQIVDYTETPKLGYNNSGGPQIIMENNDESKNQK